MLALRSVSDSGLICSGRNPRPDDSNRCVGRSKQIRFEDMLRPSVRSRPAYDSMDATKKNMY